MNLIVAMSIAGTIPVMQCILLEWTGRGKTDQHRALLRLSMFFFLCPFQKLKYNLPMKLPDFMYHLKDRVYWKREGYFSLGNLEGDYYLVAVKFFILGTVWVAVILIAVLFLILGYRRLIYSLTKTSCECSEETFELITGNRKEQKIHYKKSSFVQSPFTMGILRHMIFLPETDFSDEELCMVLLHETAHIRNKDLLFKLICLCICAIHWFNPFAWLLLYKYGTISEKICDEQVTKRFCTMEQRKRYAALLVKMAAYRSKVPPAFTSSIAGQDRGKRTLKKRIDHILHTDSARSGVFAAALLTSIVFSAATAVSYTLPTAVNEEWLTNTGEEEFVLDLASEEVYDFSESNMLYWDNTLDETINQSLIENQILPEEYDFTDSDLFFTAEKTGVKTILPGTEENQAGCVHIFAAGTVTSHTKDSSGGCVIQNHEAQKCAECRYYKLGELISEINYTKCSHG